jgi:hypothetical protein
MANPDVAMDIDDRGADMLGRSPRIELEIGCLVLRAMKPAWRSPSEGWSG